MLTPDFHEHPLHARTHPCTHTRAHNFIAMLCNTTLENNSVNSESFHNDPHLTTADERHLEVSHQVTLGALLESCHWNSAACKYFSMQAELILEMSSEKPDLLE